MTPAGTLSFLLRLSLGGLLILSGSMKLGLFKALGINALAMDPLDFAFSIRAFQLGLPDTLIRVLTFAVPWGELLVGLLLVVGFWARGAGLAAAGLMLIFIVGIASLMLRDLDVNCPCFGKLKLFCGDAPMGTCHIIRNSAFAIAGLLIAILGPGPAALDRRVRPVPTRL
ncbi:MAG: DoxX family membrane protein [Phycisphaeraceae bacterium]|jgi:uncharacterized membrane protein YphA (DoxX/SURF4 family)|nr:DoxX family membrane protein [Phycisphaeraceae bacterium]